MKSEHFIRNFYEISRTGGDSKRDEIVQFVLFFKLEQDIPAIPDGMKQN
jgi:hypothetical protein